MMQGSTKVLVVDDEESVRNLLQRTLEEAGYHVICAADGQAALEEASRQEIEVALLDIRMPGMSGVEVLRKLIASYPNTAVVMVTAVVETRTAVEAMKLGAYDYITKPFNLDDVVLRVQRAIEKQKLQSQIKNYQLQLEERVKEQAERLQEQFVELIRSLAREHAVLYSRYTQRQSKDNKAMLLNLPPELRKPMSSVEEFRDALLRILGRVKLESD